MKNIKNVLVWGYGSIGKRHTDILNGLVGAENVTLISSQSKKMNADSNFHHVAYNNLEECAIKEIDYFVIATPSQLHYLHLKELSERVVHKIILVEKPLFSFMPEESRTFWDRICANNTVLVAYNLRYYPLLAKLKYLSSTHSIFYASTEAGSYLPSWRPEKDYRNIYSAKRSMGGGVLNDLSHEIDYIQWICGKIETHKSICGKISDLEIDSDDVVDIIGKTNKHITINIRLNYFNKKPKRILRLEGKGFSAELDFITHKLCYDKEGREFVIEGNSDRNISYFNMHHAILFGDFSQCCNFREGLDTVEIIDSIYKENK